MTYSLQRFTRLDALAVLSWRYEGSYALYNVDLPEAEPTLRAFLDPANAYYSVLDERGEMAAYRCFGPDARVPGGDYKADAFDTGGGLRPDLVGQGLGLDVLLAGLDYARVMFTPPAFRVTVAEWNVRALRVCERAGFQRTTTFEAAGHDAPFVILLRNA